MTAFTIQDVSRRSGLSEPTLRYYEEVGLIGPIDRNASSGHRRYRFDRRALAKRDPRARHGPVA
jgi:DNA-binding transcriptional MerR regulator